MHRVAGQEGDYSVPIWNKANLTIKEAAAYSGIGETSLRELIEDKSVKIHFCVGRRILINRFLLDEYIKHLCAHSGND